MADLIKVLNIAVDSKPKFGEPCNNCGFCCLTEVCSVGQELTGSSVAPCNLLIQRGDKHFCHLAENEIVRKELGIGSGCCAKTQREVIDEILNQ